jgi:hypothetical protein
MRSMLLPTLLNGKDHSRQENVLSSNGIEKIQRHRIYLVTVCQGRKVPSPPSTGSHGPHLFGRSRCHRSGRRRRRRHGKPPPSHEIQHGEAAAMDPPPCLGEGVIAMVMGAGPRHRCGSRPGMHASAWGSTVRAGRDAPPPETLPREWNRRRGLWNRRRRRDGHAPMRRGAEARRTAVKAVAAASGGIECFFRSKWGRRELF